MRDTPCTWETREEFERRAKREWLEEELFAEIGRLTVKLSEIETNLAVALATLKNVDPNVTIRAFYALPTFHQRLNLVEKELEKDTEWNGNIHTWYRLAKSLKQQKAIRNLAAHQNMYYDDGVPVLRPTWLLKNPRGQTVTAEDLKAAHKELDELDLLVRQLQGFLGANDGILGGWKPS